MDRGWKDGFSCWKCEKAPVTHRIKHTLTRTGTPGICKIRGTSRKTSEKSKFSVEKPQVHKPQPAPRRCRRREFSASFPPWDVVFPSVLSWVLHLLIRIFLGVEKLIFAEVFAPLLTRFRNSAIPAVPWKRKVFKGKSLSI